MASPTPPGPSAGSGPVAPLKGFQGGPPAASASMGKDRTLVSVVWCRQVDNEAESPGYTTVPTEFAGRMETLETVRVVGNLAINAADTHDYWDPDPSSKLAYYHNLFLYPANAGKYLCLGRMFLSTEDRPRLGMKTLVLDASSLLESENLGQVLRRWYSSMGNPGRSPQAEGKADPALMDLLSDGFTFLRQDPATPVVAFVSDGFHDAVESVMTLLERAPSALAALSGVLIFPYFLPFGRVNLSELSEKFPLTLAIARIPRNEAGGDRHQKRIAGWASQAVHLLDMTSGLPDGATSRPPLPAPVSWWCRGDRPELSTDLRRAVDRVELPRYRAWSPDGDHGRGTPRRRELARLASAMSSVAVALERSPSERKTLDASTLAAAQPYLKALSLTEGAPAAGAMPASDLAKPVAPVAPSVVSITPPSSTATPVSSSDAAEPPWRRPPRLRPERPEVVPVPRQGPGGDAPPGPLEPAGGTSAPAGARPPVAPGSPQPEGVALAVSHAAAPPFAEVAKLSPALLEELRTYIDTRIGETRTRIGDLDPDVVGKLERDLERRMEARAQLLISPEALDARIVEALSRRPPPPRPDPRELLTDELKAALAEVVSAMVAQKLAESAPPKSAKPTPPPELSLSKLDERFAELLSGSETDRKTALLLEQRIQGIVSSSVADDRKATNDRLEAILNELKQRAKAQSELEASIRREVRFLDDKLQTLMGRLIPLLKKTWLKIDELDKRPSGPGGASEQKMRRLREELWGEMKRLELDLSERTRIILDRVEGNIQNQGRLWLALVQQLSSLTQQRRELERIVEESKEEIEPTGSSKDWSENDTPEHEDPPEEPTGSAGAGEPATPAPKRSKTRSAG